MPMLKVNGHRTATIADLEHAEAVMGTYHPEPAVPSPLATITPYLS